MTEVFFFGWFVYKWDKRFQKYKTKAALSRRLGHPLHAVPVVDGIALDIAIGGSDDLICQRRFCRLGLLE